MKTPKISLDNTTVATLSGGGEWIGEWVDVSEYATVTVSALADVAGTLYMEFTNNNNNSNADSSLTYDVGANLNDVHTLKRTRQFYRTRYVNGATGQTSFQVSTFFENGGSLTAPKNLALGQDADALATRDTSFDQEVAEGLRQGYSIVNVSGRNIDIDTGAAEDIWDGGGTYTGFPTESETVDVFSSDANDTSAGSGARTVRLFGLDENDALQEEDITLNGITAVTSTNTWNRVYAVEVLTSGSSNTAFNAGTITVRHTTTTANVFVVMPTGSNKSQVAAYTIPAGKTGYIKNLAVEMSRSNSATAQGYLYVKEPGASPQLRRPFSISNADSLDKRIYGGLPFPALTDITVRISSVSSNNTDVTAYFDLVLVDN